MEVRVKNRIEKKEKNKKTVKGGGGGGWGSWRYVCVQQCVPY